MSDYELLKKEMEQNQEAVNQALAEVKDQNIEIARKLERIEVGFFGDPKMNFVGVIEAQKIFRHDMESMRLEFDKRIAAVERERDTQKIETKAKYSFVDNFEIWARRIFWLVALFTIIGFALTGKIGWAEVIKVMF